MLDTELLGQLITKIGRPSFDSAFFELARRTLDINSCSVFSFEGEEKPQPVILEGHGSEQRSRTKLLGSKYVNDGFRNDPQLADLFHLETIEVRLTRPSEIANDIFRSDFYGEPRIASEITILGRYGGKRYNIGLYRGTGKPAFDQSILNDAKELASIVLPSLHRHMQLVMADPAQTDVSGPTDFHADKLEHLVAVLLADCKRISPREAQVCAAIILGYRTLAISINLGISENTICTHRKRAYAKLGISSQNELFSRYFRTVARLGGNDQHAGQMMM